MAIGQPAGTIFVELDLDSSKYLKGQKKLLKDATQTSLSLEQNFKNLGVKSSAEMDLMRAKIMNSYNMIANNAKATANDILRAETAKTAKLKALNEMQYGTQTSMFAKLKANWMGLAASATAAFFAIQHGWNMAEKAADYYERIAALNALGSQYDMTGEQIIKTMKDASRGLISMGEAADMAASALNLSLNPRQMAEFTSVAEQLTDVIGGTIPEAFNKMVVAAASGRLMTLAQMGIIIDLESEYDKYAKKIGTTKDALDAATKQQVRLNVILDAAKQKVEALGPPVDTVRDKMDRLMATIKDVELFMGTVLIRTFSGVMGVFYGAAAAAMALTSGIMKVASWVAYLMSILPGAEAADKEFYESMKMNASAAWDASEDLAQKGQDALKAVFASSTDIAAAIKKPIKAAEESAKAGKDMADAWHSAMTQMQADMAKSGLDDFEKKLVDIEKKAAEFRKKFSGIAGAEKAISAWETSMGEQAAMEAAKKDFDEYLNNLKESKQLEDEIAAKTKKHYADLKASREGELSAMVAELDMQEALGRLHTETLEERINLSKESLKIQEEYLATIDKLKDPSGWYAQQDAINKTRLSIIELNKELKEATGSFDEGLVRGMRDWLNESRSVFQASRDMAKDTAKAMQDTFSDFFYEAMTGKLRSLGDYIRAFGDTVLRSWANVMSEMIVRWAMHKITAEEATKSAVAGIVEEEVAVTSLTASYLALAAAKAASSAASSTAGVVASVGAVMVHKGGVIGSEGISSRVAPASAWNSAPRYHTGFAPDEYPAILQRGEGVFTPGQMKALGAGMKGDEKEGGTVIVINANDARSFEDMCRRNPGAIIGPVSQALRDNRTRTEWRRLLS